MLSLQDWEKYFQILIKELFGEIDVQVVFAPLVDISLGDIGSDFCVRIGKALKTAPYQIAIKVQEKIASNQNCESIFQDGIFILKLGLDDKSFIRQQSSRDLLSANSTPQNYLIIVPQSRADLSNLSFMRIFSLAWWQARLLADLKQEVKLHVAAMGTTLPAEFMTLGYLRRIISEHAKPLLDTVGSSNDTSYIENTLNASSMFVWLPNNYLSRENFHKMLDNAAKQRVAIEVQSISSEWLHPFDALPDCEQIGAWADNDLKALFYLLPSPRPALDLDLSAACLKEKSNLLWMAESCINRIKRVRERLHQHSLGQSEAHSQDIWNNVSPAIKHRIVHCLCFMDCFRAEAAYNGQVQPYITMLNDYVDAVYKLLNNPSFRLGLEQGNILLHDDKILAGIETDLSSIV